MALSPGSAQALLLQSAALPLLLQHRTVHTDVQAVLRLCCTSQAMRAAVLQHCKGLLDISYQLRSQQHAQQFAVWMTQCGQLAGSLRCWLADAPVRRPYAEGRTEEELLSMLESAEQVVAAALVQLQQKQQQQGQQDGLQLRTLVWHRIGYSSAAADLLQVLPAAKLLRLGLWQEEALEWEPHSNADISAGSIAHLTKLQSLSLKGAVNIQQLQQALPALTALTGLCMISAGSSRCRKEQFALLQQQFPTQLKELTLEVELDRHGHPPALQLSHLSCVTAFNTMQIEEGSQLPRQLLQLQCSSCRSVQPLLGSRQLQHINMHCSRAGADELSQLSRLTGLTHLSLSYAEHMYIGIADAAAPAWPLLARALKALQVTGVDPGGLSFSTFLQLKQLHGLTRLSIQVTDDHEGDAGVALPVTPVQCGEVLAELTALRTLELSMDPGRHLLLHELTGAAVAAAEAAAEAPQAGAEPAAAAAEVAHAAVEPAAAGAAAAHVGAAFQAVGGLAIAHAFAGQAHAFQAHLQAIGAQAAVLLAELEAAAGAGAVAAANPAAAAAAAPAGGVPLAAAAAQPAGQLQHEPPLGGQANVLLQAAGQAMLQGQQLLQPLQQGAQQQLQMQMMPQQVQPGPSPNMLPVTRTISQLPYLDSLELKGSGLSLETVEPLTTLTRLTRLTMSGCDFDEAAFNSLALSLSGLQRLSIGGSELVGDAALVVLARTLQHLTELNIRSCSRVTNRGVLQLTRLQQLKLLWAEDTSVSQQVVARVLHGSPRGA